MNEWDRYFKTVCDAIASKSKCLSRQIGVLIVRDHSIVSTGYNGPARGYPHCSPISSMMVDGKPTLIKHLRPGTITKCEDVTKVELVPMCPRHARGHKSGEGLLECPAAHAEVNAISNAARLGTCIRGCTMYMNTREIACKDCMTAIVNSGIAELVTLELIPYHEMSLDIARYGKIKLRRFEL